MNNILKVGLIYGAFGILLTLIINLIDKSLMLKGAVMWGSVLLGIIILIFAGRKYFRDKEVGMLSYGAAMKKLLLASIIGMLLGQVYSTVVYSNDADMKILFKEYSLNISENTLRWAMELAGANEAEIADMVDKAKEDIEKKADSSYPYSWAQMPTNLITAVVMSLFLAFITAIFVREKNTVYS